MLYTVERDLELCQKFKINTKQLFFLKILVFDPSLSEKDNLERRKKLAIKFQTVFEKGVLSKDDIADLIARDILIDNNLSGYFLYDDLELSGEWSDKLKLEVYPMADELFESFPLEITIQGKNILARNSSPEKIALRYNKAVNNNLVKHKEILDLVKWGIKNNHINVGLDKFVECKLWDLLASKRNSSPSNVEFNNVSIL